MKPQIILSYFFLLLSISVFSSTKNVRFSVDLNLLIDQKKFNPSSDKVYIRGSFNNWDTGNELTKGNDNVYFTTIGLPENTFHEYKYYISSANAENSGWENNFPIADSGNRMISIGINNLNLAVVKFNDSDMDRFKSTEHFNFYYTGQDTRYIDDFAIKAEKCHEIVSSALQSNPTEKTKIYLYKDLDQLHMAQGYPENTESSIGSAYGKSKIAMVAPSQMGLDWTIGLLSHEYTHCLEAWKTKVTLPAWLNEGVASYYGQNFSTKDWIKSEMSKTGKPYISDVFNGHMGYAYSSILAYFIIKNKGEAAMAKFIENMNYADIGYANLEALQADWWNFLDVYLDYTTNVNVKFSVDMADMISSNYFKPGTDKVFVNHHRNLYNWNAVQMNLESGTVYSVTVPLNRYNFFDYYFSTNSPTAPNEGAELKVDETIAGTRLLDLENSGKVLPLVKFNSNAIQGLDMTQINSKINALKFNALPFTTPSFSTFRYSFKILTTTEFEAQKPADSLPFDCGFVSNDGTINITAPVTNNQKAVFKDINKVAVYYLCQSYMFFFYQTKGLPLIFKVGFPAYETGVTITDTDIKAAISKYGGSFASFDVLNTSSTFIANNGIGVAMAFAEFLKVFKNWGFPLVLSISADAFDVAPWWYNTDNLKGLLDDFNRYLYARFLETNENLRIKIVQETENIRFYTRSVDAAVNFPKVSDALEKAYKEFSTNYGVKSPEKLTAFTLSDCAGAIIEGVACNPATVNIGGTANPHGLQFGCVSNLERVNDVVSLGRHELAHAFQGFLPIGATTQWLIEGFAFFTDGGPMLADFSDPVYGDGYWRKTGIASLEQGTKFFGRRPTYEDTKVYPGYETDYGYKYLGYFVNDFIYRKGGYIAVKNVQLDDLSGYKKIGYSTGQAFMDDFYFDFDVRVQNKQLVSLKTPVLNAQTTSPQIEITWSPLKVDVKLNILVSTDNKASWTEVIGKTTQTAAVWNSGEYNGKFFLKFVAPENLNLESTYGPFFVGDITKISLNFPNGGEYLIAEDTVKVSWGTTLIPNIKLEYTDNNGTSWKQINANTPTSQEQYKWVVPRISSGQCKLRITDVANSSKTDVSEKAFTILESNAVGGPFLYDKNTLLLLHFDNDLKNRSYYSTNANGSTDNLIGDPTVNSVLGNCLKTGSPLTVPHSENLSLKGDWTIEAWVKFASFNANYGMTIVTKPGDSDSYQANYTLELNPWWGNIFHGFYFSGFNSRIGNSSFTPTLNQWYHISFIRDTKNSELRLMVHDRNRNVLINNVSKFAGNETYLNTKDLLIGSYLDGFIDELRISNTIRYFKTEVESLPEINAIRIYPNPTTGIVQVALPLMQVSEIQITNTSGQTVYRGNTSGRETVTLDLNFMSPGLYLMQIKSKDYLFVKQFVKQ